MSEIHVQENSAYNELIQAQSQIAQLSADIEQHKQEIIELLNNRASTKAKIQHYDTTQAQIQTRKAELTKLILETGSSGEQTGEILKKHEVELKAVEEKISKLNAEAAAKEEELAAFQKELNEKQEKLKIGQTASVSYTHLDVYKRQPDRN